VCLKTDKEIAVFCMEPNRTLTTKTFMKKVEELENQDSSDQIYYHIVHMVDELDVPTAQIV